MKKSVGLICLLVAVPTIAAASQSTVGSTEKLSCPHRGGYIDGPFVPTAAAARKIYLAVRQAITPEQRNIRHLRVQVEDEGGHWEVYATRRVRENNGKLVVLQGGGGLGLQIDKCTGAVANAALSR